MSNLHSAIVIVLALAAIFVPHALVLYFSKKQNEREEEYVPDGR